MLGERRAKPEERHGSTARDIIVRNKKKADKQIKVSQKEGPERR